MVVHLSKRRNFIRNYSEQRHLTSTTEWKRTKAKIKNNFCSIKYLIFQQNTRKEWVHDETKTMQAQKCRPVSVSVVSTRATPSATPRSFFSVDAICFK